MFKGRPRKQRRYYSEGSEPDSEPDDQKRDPDYNPEDASSGSEEEEESRFKDAKSSPGTSGKSKFRNKVNNSVKMSGFSMADAAKMPEFSGESDVATKLRDFLNYLKFYVSTLKESDVANAISFAINCKIVGVAKTKLVGCSPKTYAELESELKKRCLPKTTPKFVEAKISNMKRRGLAIDEFAQKLEELAGEFVTLSIGDKEVSPEVSEIYTQQAQQSVIRAFKAEVHEKLSDLIEAKSPETLQEALNICLKSDYLTGPKAAEVNFFGHSRDFRGRGRFQNRGRGNYNRGRGGRGNNNGSNNGNRGSNNSNNSNNNGNNSHHRDNGSGNNSNNNNSRYRNNGNYNNSNSNNGNSNGRSRNNNSYSNNRNNNNGRNRTFMMCDKDDRVSSDNDECRDEDFQESRA